MHAKEELDQLILKNTSPDWKKLVMIIARVSRELVDDSEETMSRVADRILALVEQGRIEARGNLSLWRESEIRTRSKVRSDPG